jgi:hypothetical protein
MSNQWTAQIQQRLPAGFTAQVTYLGMENTHLFDEQSDNVINPLTGTRPYPAINQVVHKGNWAVGRFHGLIGSLQRTARNGLFVGLNYTYAHADGDISDPENVACRACSWGNLPYDVRQNLYIQSSYPLPLGHFVALRNWTISGVASIRAGLPLNVTLSRPTTAMADGNNTSERPNLVPGVSLIPAGGQTLHNWINKAAFSTPANDTWGNAGTDIVRGPGLAQVDTAVSRRINLTERLNLMLRMEAFNVFNRIQLGNPNVNFSSTLFGQITSIVNTTPIGTGTARSVQFAARFTF